MIYLGAYLIGWANSIERKPYSFGAFGSITMMIFRNDVICDAIYDAGSRAFLSVRMWGLLQVRSDPLNKVLNFFNQLRHHLANDLLTKMMATLY